MLDANHQETFYSIRELIDSVKENKKPIVFWFGAGISKWAGLPLWEELANNLFIDFCKYESNFSQEECRQLITNKQYPSFFEILKSTNSRRYNKLLLKSFESAKLSPIYNRFIAALSTISPLYIVTTNVDEILEKNVASVDSIQSNDIERTSEKISKRESFILKAHGSISSIDSMVFTESEYKKLVLRPEYLRFMENIFQNTSIVFIGTSLGDEYVIELLKDQLDLNKYLGGGPHFNVGESEPGAILKNIVKPILYKSKPHKDHRSPIQVIEEISFARDRKKTIEIVNEHPFQSIPKLKSAHMISFVLPPGTHRSSEKLQLAPAEEGKEKLELISGIGITNDELINKSSTAIHDILTGLLCFDNIYAPIEAIGGIHNVVTADIFWELIRNDLLKIVNWNNFECVVFQGHNNISSGSLESLILSKVPDGPPKLETKIKQILKSVPGREAEAEVLFNLLKEKIITIEMDGIDIPTLTSGLLFRPSIREILGISGGMPIKSIPVWSVFPILRLAFVLKLGTACEKLEIPSIKMHFGLPNIANPAFAAIRQRQWDIDDLAGYIIADKQDKILEVPQEIFPMVFRSLLKFRDTQEGLNLREAILNQLTMNWGGDIVTTINGGLKSIIDKKVRLSARNTFEGIYRNEGVPLTTWMDNPIGDYDLKLWRQKSFKILKEVISNNGINLYDFCPCNSGEKLKFCCYESLQK